MRQLNSTDRYLPTRKKDTSVGYHKMLPASMDKFLSGIWTRIHSGEEFNPFQMVSCFALPIMISRW